MKGLLNKRVQFAPGPRPARVARSLHSGLNSTPIGMPVIVRQLLQIFHDLIGHSF